MDIAMDLATHATHGMLATCGTPGEAAHRAEEAQHAR
jgi:hypothetical protein